MTLFLPLFYLVSKNPKAATFGHRNKALPWKCENWNWKDTNSSREQSGCASPEMIILECYLLRQKETLVIEALL